MRFDADISVYGHDRDAYTRVESSPAPPRTLEDQYPAAATAAVALAQLHSHQPHSEWDSEAVSISYKQLNLIRNFECQLTVALL